MDGMGTRTRALSLAVALLALAACANDQSPPSTPTPGVPSASESSPSATPAAAFTAPPLRLPTVAAGAKCPVTAARHWSGPGVASDVLGDGPLYPVADYFQLDGKTALDLRAEDKTPDGTYDKKVRWIGVGYAGPVLVRAARIDGPGAALAKFAGFGEPRNGGWFADLPDGLPDDQVDLPATTTVSGPGCFAYQVDGRNFSKTIVFRAALVP